MIGEASWKLESSRSGSVSIDIPLVNILWALKKRGEHENYAIAGNIRPLNLWDSTTIAHRRKKVTSR
jgi:hypothetical protein